MSKEKKIKEAWEARGPEFRLRMGSPFLGSRSLREV